jgi:hypothetical protein
MLKRSLSKRSLACAAMALALAGCATQPAYRTLNPSCLTADNGLKYQRDGHQDTVFITARLAGMPAREAAELSFYAQAADDIAWTYAAPQVSVWGTFGFWGYRHRVNAVLHSLHGGDADAAERRRERLAFEISRRMGPGASSDPDWAWQTGFMIHALGDSFAHTRADGTAYGELYGHLFDGHTPDLAGLRPELYQSYVIALYTALGGDSGEDFEALSDFLASVAAEGGDVDRFAAAIRSRRAGMAAAQLDCDALADRLDRGRVNAFLRDLERRL